jgi:cytochrome c-type biogenesis protein CcsB
VTPAELVNASNLAVSFSMIALAMAMVSFSVAFARGRVKSQVEASVPESGSVAVLVQEEPRPSHRAANIGMALTWLAFGVLLVGVVLRGVWAGRVPWGNMYEFSISSAAGILAVFLAISLRRDVRWLGLFIVVPVLLTLGLAVTVLYTESAQLVPALKSWWLVIHVLAAIVGGGAFTLAAASAGLALIRSRAERLGKQDLGLASRIPPAARLEQFTNRVVVFAFPIWTFAVVAGAIWAENAWGRYWGWDPKETWAFITWVVYAAYLHARSTAGWRNNRASVIAIVGWVSFLINYFGVNLFVNSLHSYAGV